MTDRSLGDLAQILMAVGDAIRRSGGLKVPALDADGNRYEADAVAVLFVMSSELQSRHARQLGAQHGGARVPPGGLN